MEDDALDLLQRSDVGDLLLNRAEVEPWLPILLERFAKFQADYPEASNESLAGEDTTRAFADAIFPTLGDMAGAVFTPDRIRQLISGLRTFRNARSAAGDTEAVRQAMGAIVSLEDEDEPSHNRFLVVLCFASVRVLNEEQ